MNENYVTGLIDSMILLNENIRESINVRTTVTLDAISLNYNIVVAWDTAFDNRTGEEVSDFISIVVPEKDFIFKKRSTLFEIYNQLEFLEKVKFDEDYDSLLKAKELKGERDGDNWRKDD